MDPEPVNLIVSSMRVKLMKAKMNSIDRSKFCEDAPVALDSELPRGSGILVYRGARLLEIRW